MMIVVVVVVDNTEIKNQIEKTKQSKIQLITHAMTEGKKTIQR